MGASLSLRDCYEGVVYSKWAGITTMIVEHEKEIRRRRSSCYTALERTNRLGDHYHCGGVVAEMYISLLSLLCHFVCRLSRKVLSYRLQ